MKQSPIWGILALLASYLFLRYYGGEVGRTILYPVNLLVTFLHEFGHAVGAIITGGSVASLRVNPDGSGVTGTIGGWRSIILMGGYVGSAIFGNLLFYIGARQPRYSKGAIIVLAICMLVSGLIWFDSLFTFGFLLAFALGLIFATMYTNWDRWILMFLGMACTIYIVQDFNVGPSSDLTEYAKIFVLIPANIWMYIWLIIVVLLSFFNLRMIFNKPLPK